MRTCLRSPSLYLNLNLNLYLSLILSLYLYPVGGQGETTKESGFTEVFGENKRKCLAKIVNKKMGWLKQFKGASDEKNKVQKRRVA